MKHYELKHYSLIDNKTGTEYTTGISLADCTIPFEDLLNKQSNYIDYYMERYYKTQKLLKKSTEEIKALKTTLNQLEEFLLEEFNMTIEDVTHTIK